MPNGAGSCPDFRLVEGSSLSIRRTLTPHVPSLMKPWLSELDGVVLGEIEWSSNGNLLDVTGTYLPPFPALDWMMIDGRNYKLGSVTGEVRLVRKRRDVGSGEPRSMHAVAVG